MARASSSKQRPKAADFLSDGDEDDDAPEAITTTQSREQARKKDAALKAVENDLAKKKKEKNRKRDEALKKRAVETRGDPKSQQEIDEDDKDEHEEENARRIKAMERDVERLKARMARAMQEAGDEDDDEGDFDEGEEFGDEDAFGGFSDEEMSDGDDDSRRDGDHSEDSSMSEDELPRIRTKKLDYLPDSIFEKALSQLQSSEIPHTTLKKKKPKESGKRRKTLNKPKELIIGGKTIRTELRKTVPNVSSTKRTLPSGEAKNFVRQALSLKSSKGKGKGRGPYERRAANIGLFRSNSGLPAAHFVRN